MDEVNEVLRAHDAKLREWVAEVEAKASMLERERNTLQAMLNAKRDNQRSHKREIAIAYESRDQYREVAVAISELHQGVGGNKCTCGGSYPCATIQAARQADPGIAREFWPDLGGF